MSLAAVGCGPGPAQASADAGDPSEDGSSESKASESGGTSGGTSQGESTSDSGEEVATLEASTAGDETADGSTGEDTGTSGPPGEEVRPDQQMTCEGGSGSGTSGGRFEVECGHGVGCPTGVTGSQSGTELENDATTIGYFEPGDWIAFEPVELDGVRRAIVRYAKADGAGEIEIRLGSPEGTVLGRFAPATTGGWSTWNEAEVPLPETTGAHAVVLVAVGDSGGIANLDWVELASDTAALVTATATQVFVNHLGYAQTGPKHAVIRGEGGPLRYVVSDASGAGRWCGDLEPVGFDAWGGGTYYVADFSGLSVAGSYRVSAGDVTSEPFEIGRDHVFTATVDAVVGYFRGARADDEAVWSFDGAAPLTGADRTADVRGGWYDASGDISKYLSHLSYANFMNPQQIPLVAWALAFAHDEAPERLGGALEAVESEALWGADYLMRALDPEGYFYINVFDGWSGNVEARQVCAFVGSSGAVTPEFQAAFREGAGMAIAALARIGRWGVGGSFSSAEYIAAAERAFSHVGAMGPTYADDGRENIIDDYTALLAAAELYAANTNSAYLDAARARVSALVERLHPDGYFIADDGTRPFWHASDAGLPVVALARYVEIEPSEERRDLARATIAAHLGYLARVTQATANPFGYARQHFVSEGSIREGFFMPHDNETEYWWQGENARLASLAAAAFLGGRKIVDPERLTMMGIDPALARFGGRQLDWILGENPYDISFLHGYGRNNPPEYAAAKPEIDTHVGGISNGITGAEIDGSGIQWLNGEPDAVWEDWRWVEQWLPHAAWYLVAIAAMEEAA